MSDDKTEDAGRNLRILMADRNINTLELSQMSGLSQAAISNLRTGKVKKPNIDTANILADLLGVKISDIWPDIWY